MFYWIRLSAYKRKKRLVTPSSNLNQPKFLSVFQFAAALYHFVGSHVTLLCKNVASIRHIGIMFFVNSFVLLMILTVVIFGICSGYRNDHTDKDSDDQYKDLLYTT